MRGFFDIEVDRKRVFGLDLLRAFAIFCVVHGHGERLLYDTRLNCFTDLPLPHGVDIFFVMSGFLIGKSLLSYMQKHDESLDRPKILSFYLRTALRILPNYLFILIVNYILVESHVIQGNTQTFSVWYFVTFTQNLFTPFWDFYWESWSLPVQWWFYILFPLMLALFCRFLKPKQFVPFLRKTVASRMDNIFIGVMAAWVQHYYPEFWDRNALKSLIFGLVLFVITNLIPRVIGSLYFNVLHLTLSALAIALWFPIFTKIKSYKTIVGSIVSRVSILSYAMFLTNSLIIQVMDKVCPKLIEEQGVAAYFIYWLVVMVVSYLLYILLERTFIRIRSKIQ